MGGIRLLARAIADRNCLGQSQNLISQKATSVPQRPNRSGFRVTVIGKRVKSQDELRAQFTQTVVLYIGLQNHAVFLA